jgi:hypothetical protein
LQKKQLKEAHSYLNSLIHLCENGNLLFEEVEAIFQLIQGDIYYRMELNKEARVSYARSLECSEQGSFGYAWASYRCGLLTDEPKEAERYFRQASQTFDLLKYEDQCARSEGERGTALVESGRPVEFVRIVEWMCRRYFLCNKSAVAPACTMGLAQLTRLKCDFRKEEIPKVKGKTYPKFERCGYQSILDTVKPEVGGIVALYSLSDAYSILDSRNRKIRCLRTTLSLSDITQLDKRTKALAIFALLRELIPNGNRTEIKRVVVQGVSLENFQMVVSSDELLPQELKGLQKNPDDFLSFCIFYPLDEKIATFDDSQAQQFTIILNEIESTLQEENHKKLGWWLAEIYLRKATLAEKYFGQPKGYRLWKIAYEYSLDNGNYNILFYSAHSLGFMYPEYSKGLRELSDIHMNTIRAISSLGRNYEQLVIVGKNLFKFWKAIGWRRLSEHDLRARQTLLDGAKTLAAAGFSEDDAGPIMILLLSSIYDFKGPCIDWAIAKASHQKQEIPSDVMEKILSYMNSYS